MLLEASIDSAIEASVVLYRRTRRNGQVCLDRSAEMGTGTSKTQSQSPFLPNANSFIRALLAEPLLIQL